LGNSHQNQDGSYLTNVEMAFFLKSINFSKCRLVGDIGAEAGKFSLLAAEKNVDVVALDIDLPGLKRLRFKNKLVNVVLADARNIPLKEGILDAAFMMEVIDYIPESDTVLSKCSRILKTVARWFSHLPTRQAQSRSSETCGERVTCVRMMR
jgi:ubiquinone/menaquinone biosynthesis C-methylase UbiE